MSQYTPPYAYDSMEEIAGGREGRTLEVSDATRARQLWFPRKETSPEGNRRTPGHNTHVTDNVGGIRHGRNTRNTRVGPTKWSYTFTDERRAHLVLGETLQHFYPKLAKTNLAAAGHEAPWPRRPRGAAAQRLR